MKAIMQTGIKPKTPHLQRNKVIYAIKCKNCQNNWYVGLTTQKMVTRVSQHKCKAKALNEAMNAPIANSYVINDIKSKSALYTHMADTKHQFDFDNAKMIDQKTDYTRLKFAEMLHILDRPTCNFRKDVQGVSAIYSGIMQHLKTNKKVAHRKSRKKQNSNSLLAPLPTQ